LQVVKQHFPCCYRGQGQRRSIGVGQAGRLPTNQTLIDNLVFGVAALTGNVTGIKYGVVDSTGQCNIMHTGNYRGFQNAAASIKDQRADPSAEAGAMGSMEERPVA